MLRAVTVVTDGQADRQTDGRTAAMRKAPLPCMLERLIMQGIHSCPVAVAIVTRPLAPPLSKVEGACPS